jgi:hypothetical protein
MGDTTAKVGMTPTSKSSMAASAAAMKTSGRQFEMPKIELPANLRELVKEVMAQTSQTMRVLVSTQSAAAKSIVDYRAWLMKVAHGNVIAAFDFAQKLATAKSVPDVIEYSRAHARIQFDALAAQTNELTELAREIGRASAKAADVSISSRAFS